MTSITDTWGDDSLNSVGTQVGYIQWNVTCTASDSGVLQTIGLNLHAAAGNLRLAIYDSADNLLGESASTAAVAGFNDLTIPGDVPIVVGNTYRLAQQVDNAGAQIHYKNVGAGTGKYVAQAYGAFPASLPAGTAWDGQWYMRMTYVKGPVSIIIVNTAPPGPGS